MDVVVLWLKDRIGGGGMLKMLVGNDSVVRRTVPIHYTAMIWDMKHSSPF